jgi:acyl-CoA synthetase (AMP-forming)/AMP-acid ligase II
MIKHPAVAMSAVIGNLDPVRTEIINAFLVLKPGTSACEEMASDIKEFVKTRGAALARNQEEADKLPGLTASIYRLLRYPHLSREKTSGLAALSGVKPLNRSTTR